MEGGREGRMKKEVINQSIKLLLLFFLFFLEDNA